MDDLLPVARAKAIAPISGFPVGAVARGLSGALYLGANLEFPGHPLNASVHAEQSAVASAWMHGERGITALATTATPCGHCRQFLAELAGADRLTILTRGAPPATLGALLPASFGPGDLGVSEGLMDDRAHGLKLEASSADSGSGSDSDSGSASDSNSDSDSLLSATLAAADRSHAPYSKTYAGVALELDDGTIRPGSYAESAAFNPSLSPLQVALNGLALAGIPFDRIRAAALVEAAGPASQRAATEALLASSAPSARFIYAQAAAT